MRARKSFVIAIAASTALLSGCGIFHSSKSLKQTYQRDSINQVLVKETAIDTGTITTREVNYYKYLSPQFNASKSLFIAPQDLLKKLTSGLIAIDTGMLEVNLGYDSLKHTLTVNAKKRPESGEHRQEKTTTEKKGLSTTKQSQQNTQVKEKATVTHKETKPDYGWIPWLGVIIAVLVAAIFGFNPLVALFKHKPDANDNIKGS